MIGVICAIAAGRAVYLSYKMPESKELVEAKERGGDLLATIVSYIECGFNLGITANAMHLHRNSMVYRLNRIAEKSGIDLLGSPQNYDLIALLITAKLYLSRL
ncbi:MAG: helix-turn-helix domain-containing protein [Eggerthellales bacterium]|nr:helix-turn-helix domain-containing protein [Eggerthellales bacterium]